MKCECDVSEKVGMSFSFSIIAPNLSLLNLTRGDVVFLGGFLLAPKSVWRG